MTIIEYIESPKLFGKAFKDLSSWKNWIAYLKALYALPMSDEELEAYRKFSGRALAPTEPFEESWLACGRRAGKSWITSTIAVYEALEGDWKLRLPGGNDPYIFLVAVDRAQANLLLSYIRHLIHLAAPQQFLRDVADEIALKNGVIISVRAGNLRSLRGYSVALALVDECAFLRSEDGGYYSNPLEELINSIEPALIPRNGDEPGAKLICLSTPFSRFGMLFDKISECWGNDNADALAWRGATADMNPTFSHHKIERALKKDPSKARAEYLGEFREDVSNLLDAKMLEAAMGGAATPHLPLLVNPDKKYCCFLDASSGRQDAFAMAIGFKENYGEQIVCARCDERLAPCDVAKVTEEYAAIMKVYGIHTAIADHHAAGWVESAFRKHGIEIEFTKLTKSDLYLEFAGLLAMGKLWLPFSEPLRQQFLGLERRVERSGLERVDHAPFGGARDDLANAVAGLCTILSQSRGRENWTPADWEKGGGPIKQHGSPEGRRRESAEALEKELRDWMEEGLGKLNRIVKW